MPQNKRIINVLILMSILFISLIGYLTYFELFMKADIISSAYNRRQWQRETGTLRGTIFDSTGIAIAKSEIKGERQERIYPYGPLYSHVVGYNSTSYGKSLLEAKFNNDLLNINPLNPVLDLKDRLLGKPSVGNNLILTIDHGLQAYAADLLGNRSGAVVVLKPKTGEILAMVSKPDYDPNRQSLEENWNQLVEAEDDPLLPRATQGLYVPGSTFKVAISLMAVEKGWKTRTFEDTGTVVIDGKPISNSGNKAYGTLDLTHALAVSSNVVFSQIGVGLGQDNLKKLAKNVGIGRKIPFDLPVSSSRFDYQTMSKTDQAAVGMGQGKILVTPLHMALITAGIANNGVVMQPFIVDRVVSPQGTILKDREPEELFRIAPPDIAGQVKEMMQEVVVSGTGKNARIWGVNVAGKTGTAQNELSRSTADKEHAWFIGFAPAEDPQIAVAVILAYSGSTGGGQAAPIARELMVDWLKKLGML
ncbi:peptidoglycan D,D-transpeptidase FtsI family protein [Candidatus Formimonas warabiya]|uniref:Beta-lactamase n=1 Tax=Formimonas warabiya TaxID=1761012 RepID=A0A3G1KUF1_FORW1|nr:penicillin-binding transpeptidase domain-containing protein [Candidatus Formimonas warabiya]ATW26071.1 peptidoglycan glycosyltransferase [Candidatus Formimonas warabiya]